MLLPPRASIRTSTNVVLGFLLVTARHSALVALAIYSFEFDKDDAYISASKKPEPSIVRQGVLWSKAHMVIYMMKYDHGRMADVLQGDASYIEIAFGGQTRKTWRPDMHQIAT